MIEIKIQGKRLEYEIEGKIADIGNEMAEIAQSIAKIDFRLIQAFLIGILEVVPREKLEQEIDKICYMKNKGVKQ